MSPSGSAQPSILSFFHKKQSPTYAAPPSQTQAQAQTTKTNPAPPPQAPPIPRPSPAAIAPQTAPRTTILSPHPSATIVPVEESHISALRRIHALLLPVNYTDGFYNGLLDPSVSGHFSRAILWQNDPATPPKVVGGLVCRLEPTSFAAGDHGRYDADLAKRAAALVSPTRESALALYIQSLVLLAPYRGLGLAAALLEGISADAAAASPALRIEWVYAHVWTENEDGLAWYGRRGFERDALLDKYYWKLKPDSAWVVKRRVAAAPRVENGAGAHGGEGAVHELPAAVPPSVTAAAVNLPGFAAAAASGPPQDGPPSRPPPPASSLSFQNKRPDMEWNDLPEEMVSSSKNSSRSDLLAPPSGSSSRSCSTGRKKRDRAYPTAAFGS